MKRPRAEEASGLAELFRKKRSQLLSALESDASAVSHAPTKGRGTELNWMRMLEVHLPERYTVGSGFVIDSTGKTSQQIDLVVYDRQYSTVFHDQNDILIVPAESVYAVFEVKPEISKPHVRYAGEKIASVRRLRRTTAPIPSAGGTLRPRRPFSILGGLLAKSSGWNPPFGTRFVEAHAGLGKTERIDLGCILEAGGYEMTGNAVDVAEGERALVFFYLRLLARLQALATAPAIDFREYARPLGPPKRLPLRKGKP